MSSYLNPEGSPPPPRDHYDEAIARPDEIDNGSHKHRPQDFSDDEAESFLAMQAPELGLVGKIIATIFVGVPVGLIWLGIVLWLARLVF